MSKPARPRAIGGARIAAPAVIKRVEAPVISIRDILKDLVSLEELERLIPLKYNDGTEILNVNDKEVLYVILMLIQENGFEATFEFLSGISNRQDIMWGNSELERQRENMRKEIELFKDRRKGVKRDIKCRFCNNYTFVVEQKQTRGADEGFTMKYICTLCQKPQN